MKLAKRIDFGLITKYFTTVLIMLITSGICALAQYKFEFGGYVGGSSYLGDANATKLFAEPQSAIGGLVKYNFTPRYAMKLQIMGTSVSGNSSGQKYQWPNYTDITFNSSFFESSLTGEYNFFPFTTEKINFASRLSPYVFAGIGFDYFQTGRSDFALMVPFGIGIKYKLFDRLTIGADMGMRKLFSDDLEYTGDSELLTNPLGLNSSKMVNNDYYTTFGFFVTFSLFKREWDCVEKKISL